MGQCCLWIIFCLAWRSTQKNDILLLEPQILYKQSSLAPSARYGIRCGRALYTSANYVDSSGIRQRPMVTYLRNPHHNMLTRCATHRVVRMSHFPRTIPIFDHTSRTGLANGHVLILPAGLPLHRFPLQT